MSTVYNDDVVFIGSVNMGGATSVTHKSGSVTNADVAAAAGVAYDKQDHHAVITCSFDVAATVAPVVYRQIAIGPRSAATLRSIHFGLADTGSSTNIDFDLLIDGTSALSAVVNVDHGDADFAHIAGTLTTTAGTSGQVIEAQVKTVTSATNAKGPFAIICLSYPAPT